MDEQLSDEQVTSIVDRLLQDCAIPVEPESEKKAAPAAKRDGFQRAARPFLPPAAPAQTAALPSVGRGMRRSAK
jgi:hypothetical protein